MTTKRTTTGRPVGRPPAGKVKMTDVERTKLYRAKQAERGQADRVLRLIEHQVKEGNLSPADLEAIARHCRRLAREGRE